MNEVKLKPCPFCGGEAELKHEKLFFSQISYVECKGCHARISNKLVEANWCADEEAQKAWNKRETSEKIDTYIKGYLNLPIPIDIYSEYPYKTATDALEELDPSENYAKADVSGLDAFERQMKRLDIKVGDITEEIKKFFKTPEGRKLFPEYVRRVIRSANTGQTEEIFENVCHIFEYIATNYNINKEDKYVR